MNATDEARLRAALERFDAANAEDPNQELRDGHEWPKELWYAQRLSAWLMRLAPDASVPLQLAARCQHLRRWRIPRDTYPMDREGYRAWRRRLQDFHAAEAAAILRDVGYDEDTIARVDALLHKRRLKRDAEAQMLEDAICIVFLENYFETFRRQHERGKLLGILCRTWGKMSERGREVAMTLPMSAEAAELLQAALKKDEG